MNRIQLVCLYYSVNFVIPSLNNNKMKSEKKTITGNFSAKVTAIVIGLFVEISDCISKLSWGRKRESDE